MTTTQLYRDYQYDLSLIDSRFQDILLSNKGSLEEDVWVLDVQSIELLLEGILQHPDISYLKIEDTEGIIEIAKGLYPEENHKIFIIPLTYKHRGLVSNIGELTVVATLGNVYQRLFDTALIILLSQAIKTLLVSFFIGFIVWRLITRHLAALKSYALSVDIGDVDQEIKLSEIEANEAIPDEFKQLVGALNTMRSKLHESYSQLEHQSLHDHLTGLPNRLLLESRVEHQLVLSERSGQYGAILFLDLDHFKGLNDSLGHHIGDEVLCQVAKRAERALRAGDTVSRLGGDEFVVLLTNLSCDENIASREAIRVGEKIRSNLNEKIKLDGHSYQITSSMGIKLFVGTNVSCESIFKHADNAMYHAKGGGRNLIRLYRPEMQKAVDNRLLIEESLISAVENDEFILHYQPQYNGEGQIISAEALIRWKSKGGTLVPPIEFIGIAEESELIIAIGAQVIEKTFALVSASRSLLEAGGVKRIAINISPKQFGAAGFVDMIVSKINEHGLEPSLFTLELTEDVLVTDLDKTVVIMNVLKQHGFKVSIDDFGTGYSSLKYLKLLPINELKIDRSFIANIDSNPHDRAIASAIISLANNFGIDVVAEGVETKEQMQILKTMGCRVFQGYFFSRPMPSKKLIDDLEIQAVQNSNNSFVAPSEPADWKSPHVGSSSEALVVLERSEAGMSETFSKAVKTRQIGV